MNYERVATIVLSIMLLAGPAMAQPQTYRLTIDGLACRFCLEDVRILGGLGVEKELLRIDGVVEAQADLEQGTVVVTLAEGAILDIEQIELALVAAAIAVREAIRIPEFRLSSTSPAEN